MNELASPMLEVAGAILSMGRVNLAEEDASLELLHHHELAIAAAVFLIMAKGGKAVPDEDAEHVLDSIRRQQATGSFLESSAS